MKKKTTYKNIQTILTEAGFVCEGDNRTRAIKGCNTALKNGVNISIVKKGKMRTTKISKKNYNIKISAFGLMRVSLTQSDFIEAFDVLKVCASFLQGDDIRNKIKMSASSPCECHKCRGRGIIPYFMYYANGVCFDCMGSGITGDYNIKNLAK